MNHNNTSTNNDGNKEYLSTSLFLLRKYVREKRADMQRVQREDGPLVDRNCFLMKLTNDTLQLLTDLDSNITNFEITLKSKCKKVDEKLKLISSQRQLLRSQPRLIDPGNSNEQEGFTSKQEGFTSKQEDRINVSQASPRAYQKYLPNDITIEPVLRSSPPTFNHSCHSGPSVHQSSIHQSSVHQSSIHQSSGRPMPNVSNVQPVPIVMRFGIPKNQDNRFRVIDSTVRPFLDDSHQVLPKGKPDLSLTQCPFCPSQRFFNIKASLLRHIHEDHPENLATYTDIFSLTPESYVSNSGMYQK